MLMPLKKNIGNLWNFTKHLHQNPRNLVRNLVLKAPDRTGANLVRSGAAFCCWGKTTHNHAHTDPKHVQLQSRKTLSAFGQLQVRTSGTARLYCKLEPAFSRDSWDGQQGRLCGPLFVALRLSRCPARWQISNFLQRCKVHGVSPACEASFTAGLTATLTHHDTSNSLECYDQGHSNGKAPISHLHPFSFYCMVIWYHMIFDVKSHGISMSSIS